MIKTFKHKGLAELFTKSRTGRIDARLHKRILRRLEALDAAEAASDMNNPGYDFHALSGDRKGAYTVHVNGPWCITFNFEDGHAVNVNFEQYH
jgi:proteic killer suppression protein